VIGGVRDGVRQVGGAGVDQVDEAAAGELRSNALLAALPDEELDRLRPLVEVEDVEVRREVFRRREPITEVHFPLSSVYSMVALTEEDRVQVEVATIGYEGMVGLPLFLGATASPNAVFAQVAGRSAVMSAADLGEFLASDGALHGLLHRYTQTSMVQVSQNVVCNSAHSTECRTARWLLTTADRVRNDTFPLTQDFLAQMLGVRRQTVSEAAGRLQADELIRYSRGTITILDRQRLEAAACECYRIIREEFEAVGG
jgi:CRP-like cAMP-binding protein